MNDKIINNKGLISKKLYKIIGVKIITNIIAIEFL
jgi:hypothetical protein